MALFNFTLQNELELQETITNLQEHIKQAEEMNNELQQQLVIKLQEYVYIFIVNQNMNYLTYFIELTQLLSR